MRWKNKANIETQTGKNKQKSQMWILLRNLMHLGKKQFGH